MGVEYYLTSESGKVAYELGKGPWSVVFDRTKSPDQESIKKFMMEYWEQSESDNEWVNRVSTELGSFVITYPDWRLRDDFSADILVTETGIPANEIERDMAQNDFEFYKCVGSRYERKYTSLAASAALCALLKAFKR